MPRYKFTSETARQANLKVPRAAKVRGGQISARALARRSREWLSARGVKGGKAGGSKGGTVTAGIPGQMEWAAHVRWHINREMKSGTCQHCRSGKPPESFKTESSTVGEKMKEPVPSESLVTKLVAIINKRSAYNMQEFAEHCRSFTSRVRVEA